MKRGVCMLNGSDLRKNKRITFLAYREWALRAVQNISKNKEIEVVDVIKSKYEYEIKIKEYREGYVDCIILIGWSWIIKDDILNRFLCVGIHPSDLPMYRGGSPIQHQIIAGMEKTKISLMTISSAGIDTGDIWGKEEWDMSGKSMDVILEELSKSSERLLTRFIEKMDSIYPQKQDLTLGSYYKRRLPCDSKVTWQQLSDMKLIDVYNLIRALGDPYPNLYIEDEEGNVLKFKSVEYVRKNQNL